MKEQEESYKKNRARAEEQKRSLVVCANRGGQRESEGRRETVCIAYKV